MAKTKKQSSDTVAPGTRVEVKIVKEPTNTAARKTLVRLLSKDAAAVAENRRLRNVRASNYSPSMRGGRLYGGRVVKIHPVKGRLGESGTLTATADVIADLRSVQRFVAVTPA